MYKKKLKLKILKGDEFDVGIEMPWPIYRLITENILNNDESSGIRLCLRKINKNN